MNTEKQITITTTVESMARFYNEEMAECGSFEFAEFRSTLAAIFGADVYLEIRTAAKELRKAAKERSESLA